MYTLLQLLNMSFLLGLEDNEKYVKCKGITEIYNKMGCNKQ